jgi:hypothetical protein
MANTGNTSFNTLTQIYTDSGLPTGSTKSNASNDVDYVPPVLDLENCPLPSPPADVVNSIGIKFINNSSQPITLSNVAVGVNGIIFNSYYEIDSLSLLPAQFIDAPNASHINDYTDLAFKLLSLLLNPRVRIRILYKRHSEGVFTVLREFNGIMNNDINEQSLETTREIVGSNNINLLKIEFLNNPIPPNNPPTVNAGTDQSITINSPLTLTGTATDSDGIIVSQIWEQISGPSDATIVAPSALSTAITDCVVGTYVFRLSATDNEGATSSDIVQVIINPLIELNGIVNVLVDPNMASISDRIESISLTPYNDTDPSFSYASVLNNTSGVVIYTPLKGRYRLSISLKGPSIATSSLSVQWQTESRKINLPEEAVYVFENVIVDDGVLIFFSSVIESAPTSVIKFVELVVQTPTVSSINVLPNGLVESTIGNVDIDFKTVRIGGTPIAFTGFVNYTKTITDNINSTTSNIPQQIYVNASSSSRISELQAIKEFDYDLAIPLKVDQEFTWVVAEGEGYLIIV